MGTIFPPVFIGFPPSLHCATKKGLDDSKKNRIFGDGHVVLKPNHDRSTEIHEKMGYSWYSDGIRSWGDIN